MVDDDAAICELLETVLTRDGCTVDTESDPTKAEARVRAGGYHLLLLDVMMPQQDGLETLRRVRALDRDLAVVMITGFPSVETAVQAMQMEAMDYLRKPFTVEALREVVTRVLRRRGLLRAPEEQVLRAIGEAVRTRRHGLGLTLLRDHDVYVTDWHNVRDIPLAAGPFDLDAFIEQIIGFVDWLGPHTHLVAVCQPTVPTLAAVRCAGGPALATPSGCAPRWKR